MSINKGITFRRRSHTESLELHFWIRFFALIIDVILIHYLLIPVILWLTGASINWHTEPIVSFTGMGLLSLSFYWLYFSVLEGTIGTTLGKLFVRLRIYNTNGSKLGLAKAFLRFPLKVISIMTIFGGFMIDINKKKQGMHDLICGTIVRRK